MLVPVDWVYFIVSALFLVPWFIVYNKRKDLRKEMIISSLVVAIGILPTKFLWAADWWNPPTITGTILGIEDIITGFAIGGLMAVSYEFFMRKSHYRDKKIEHSGHWLHFVGIISLLWAITYILYKFGLHTFYANMIGILVAFSIIVYLRRDLFIPGIYGGAFVVLIASPAYFIGLILNSNWLEASFLFDNLFQISQILRFPVEDILWWFGAGLITAPLFEFAFQERLRKTKS